MENDDKNDDYYHKGREGGGQRVMIEIIISENDDNDGWPLKCKLMTVCIAGFLHSNSKLDGTIVHVLVFNISLLSSF